MQLLKLQMLLMLNTPYVFGGNNALTGMDCSALVCELLRSHGVIGREDLSAQMLFNRFEKTGLWNSYTFGALAFFGKSTSKITHVAVLLDEYRMIEAGGGSAEIDTLEEARARGAMVRIRPLKSRSDLVAVIKPFYTSFGMFD